VAKTIRPKSISIGAKSYKVFWKESDWLHRPNAAKDESCWGSTDHMTLGIWINPIINEQNKRETLLHEVLHAIHGSSGGDIATEAMGHMDGVVDTEEYIVSRIESHLFGFLRDNPAALNYLLG
jgi:hypothetical protein